MQRAYLISWKREREWGSQPDGYSLHTSQATARRFVQEYACDHQPAGATSDGYSHPDSTPIPVEIAESLHSRLLGAAGEFLRFWQSQGAFKSHMARANQETAGTYALHGDDETFIDMVLLHKANPEDLEDFIQDYHRGPQVRALPEALGLTIQEYDMLKANPTYLYTVLFNKLRPCT